MPYDTKRQRFSLEATEPVWADSTWQIKEDIPEKGVPIEEEEVDHQDIIEGLRSFYFVVDNLTGTAVEVATFTDAETLLVDLVNGDVDWTPEQLDDHGCVATIDPEERVMYATRFNPVSELEG